MDTPEIPLPPNEDWRSWVYQETYSHLTRPQATALLASWERRAHLNWEAWNSSPLSLQGQLARARFRELDEAASVLERTLDT